MLFNERFNGKLRDDCLNSHVFASVSEAQEILDAWREDYNLVRPPSSLQDRTRPRWAQCGSTTAKEDRIELETAGRFMTISPS